MSVKGSKFSFESYEESLLDSFDTVGSTIDKIVSLRKSANKQLDTNVRKEINEIERELVLENLKLTRQKDFIKNRNNELFHKLALKYSRFNQLYNPKLCEFKELNLTNSLMHQRYNDELMKLPQVKSIDLDNTNDKQWLDDLNKDKITVSKDLDVLASVEVKTNDMDTTGSINSGVNFMQVEFEDADEIINHLKEVIRKEEIKRFRLTNLNDKIYERERVLLNRMNSKWIEKLGKLNDFIDKDCKLMKNEIKSVRGDKEAEAEEQMILSGNRVGVDEDDDDFDDDEVREIVNGEEDDEENEDHEDHDADEEEDEEIDDDHEDDEDGDEYMEDDEEMHYNDEEMDDVHSNIDEGDEAKSKDPSHTPTPNPVDENTENPEVIIILDEDEEIEGA
ncbi:hypothetical protein B5S28_g4147 [[Candida] boidinii]|nr:hypothetical protein B5S28_g4147 [[Candida] boidinii]OWB74110.1 hypothetical protein B5S31_g3889 [[Candida] boidinii]OWB80200.1 hypothetical protein B5S32_g4458 [[Candida] boidinii]